MRLEIRTTPMLIGIETTKPRQEIQQPKGDQSIQQPAAELIIDRELPQVRIDQYQCFAEAGLKNNPDLYKEYADLGRQNALDYIGRIAQEGDAFMSLEDGRSAGEVAAAIAEGNAWNTFEVNIDVVPKSRPQIDFTGHLHIQWQPRPPVIDYQPNKPIHSYQRGQTNVYIRQWGKVDIQYLDQKV